MYIIAYAQFHALMFSPTFNYFTHAGRGQNGQRNIILIDVLFRQHSANQFYYVTNLQHRTEFRCNSRTCSFVYFWKEIRHVLSL